MDSLELERTYLAKELPKEIDGADYVEINKMMGGRSGLPEGFLEERERELCLKLFDEYNRMEKKIY